MVNTVWKFATAGTLHFGRGSRFRLPQEMLFRRCTKPLIVTDSTVASLAPVCELQRELESEGISSIVFEGGQPEPATEVAESAIHLAQAHPPKDDPVDCVVGIGGGSNLDVAKIVAVVLTHGGKPADYFGFDQVPGPILPVYALPTTAGTGSEVSHSAVLTDCERASKVSTLSAWLRPTVALVDPELSDSCPPSVTAHSGIDALVHAVEAFTNRDYSEMEDVDPQARAYEGSYVLTRTLASEAVRRIGRSLVVACADPDNKTARDDMALAATLAGMAFSNSGVGMVHALEYPIGALTHCSHGEGNGLLLPHVMRYNRAVCEPEFRSLAEWLGGELEGLSLSEASEAAIVRIEEIQQQIGLRTRLRDLGLPSEAIPSVAQKAFEIKRLMDINRQVPQLADLEKILHDAF